SPANDPTIPGCFDTLSINFSVHKYPVRIKSLSKDSGSLLPLLRLLRLEPLRLDLARPLVDYESGDLPLLLDEADPDLGALNENLRFRFGENLELPRAARLTHEAVTLACDGHEPIR